MTRGDPAPSIPCLPPTPAAIQRAARLIQQGELVVIPTDTIYGLAADATNDAAVERVFRAKGRAPGKPLLALVASRAMAESCAAFCSRARALADEFWPGPLTLVLPRIATSPLSPLVDRGARGVSLRFPANEPACAVVAQAGCPVTAPSDKPRWP